MLFSKIINLRKNMRGNVALIGALLLPVVALTIGASIDIARVNSFQAKLQAANDAAVLDLVKENLTPSEKANSRAKEIISGELSDTSLSNYVSRTANGNDATIPEIVLTTNATAPLSFSGLLGIGNININVVSAVRYGANAQSANIATEIAIVLDQTASMNENNKIGALKIALDNVLSKIDNSKAPSDKATKVAIIPFHTQVRIDPLSKFSFINYGVGRSSRECNPNNSAIQNWYPMCYPIGEFNADAVCATINGDRSFCRNNIKFFDQPLAVNGNEKIYNQIAISYEVVSGGYTIHKHTIQFTYTEGYNITNAYKDETGWHDTWVAGSEILTIDSQSDYFAPNLNDYNSAPSGYNSMGGDVLNWVRDFYLGYGPGPAESYEYKPYAYYGPLSQSTKRFMDRPALTDHWNEWEGCIEDRDQDYDTNANPFNASIASTYYRAQICYHTPLATMLPLTADINAARAKVQSIVPSGYTNITIGVQWGMEALSPSEPFAAPTGWDDKNVKKIMILMTDGYNTANRFNNEVAKIDPRTRLACENAKALGIKLYVIKFIDGDSNLLKECATSADTYFDISQVSKIEEVFNTIFTDISSSSAKNIFISK
jgi:Flp pilus assembly protein TadG